MADSVPDAPVNYTQLLVAGEEKLRGSCRPHAIAFWTGYRLGVLDAMIAPAAFDGWLDREVDGLEAIAKSGDIAGRAGMMTTEVLNQLERQSHEAVARMTGIGVSGKHEGGKTPRCL